MKLNSFMIGLTIALPIFFATIIGGEEYFAKYFVQAPTATYTCKLLNNFTNADCTRSSYVGGMTLAQVHAETYWIAIGLALICMAFWFAFAFLEGTFQTEKKKAE